MPFQPRFWITAFNLLIGGFAGVFLWAMSVHGPAITCGHHWENDLMLVTVMAFTASAGTALVSSFFGSRPAQVLWWKAQQALARICYGLTLLAIIALIPDGFASGWRITMWGSVVSVIPVAVISGMCDACVRKYLR